MHGARSVFLMHVVEQLFDLGDSGFLQSKVEMEIDQAHDGRPKVELGVEETLLSEIGIAERICLPETYRIAGKHGITIGELPGTNASVMHPHTGVVETGMILEN